MKHATYPLQRISAFLSRFRLFYRQWRGLPPDPLVLDHELNELIGYLESNPQKPDSAYLYCQLRRIRQRAEQLPTTP